MSTLNLFELKTLATIGNSLNHVIILVVMRNLTFLLLLSPLFLFQALDVSGARISGCEDLRDENGNITEFYEGPRDLNYEKCWTIHNPDNQLIIVDILHLDFAKKSCSYVYLTIENDGRSQKFCHDSLKKKLVGYSNVTVYFYVDRYELEPENRKNFQLSYNIDNSIGGVEGVVEAHWKASLWLKSNSSSWKWINHIPKAVTALALSGGADFNGNNQKDELMVKQRELKISVTLLRDSISNEQLSTFINSVLSSCHNPRSFYGHNLVTLLQNQVLAENFTHPAAYLALCNADETWPDKAYGDLIRTLGSNSSLPFQKDLQAFAAMALSCKFRRTENHTIPKGEKLSQAYERVIQKFKRLQQPSGSFGNAHRTALLTQTLIASGHEYDDDWKASKAAKYLINSKSFPQNDFLSTYFTLPLLKSKSLADIGFINCSNRRDDDDLVHEVVDYLGPKIQVQYSLFIGDNKDVIHSITVKVPSYFTAFDVMKFAALKDAKYKLKYEMESGKLDIYEIAKIPNDSEDGKFWLFYLKEATEGQLFTHFAKGPAETRLREGDHIAMWYKRAIYFHA